MSKPQLDAVVGVFRATRTPDAAGVRVDEFVRLLVAAGIPSEAARRSFVRIVVRSNDLDADAEAEADLDAFVDAVAETAAETDETFFRVAAAVVDAAIRAEEEKEEAEEEEAFEERRLTCARRRGRRGRSVRASGVGRQAEFRLTSTTRLSRRLRTRKRRTRRPARRRSL